MRLKTFAIILFLIAASSMADVNAQQKYKTGIGLRGGYPSGVTIKQFLSNTNALEGIVSFGWGGIGITGLLEIHNNIPDLPGFRWYYGGGAHFATAKANARNPFANSVGGELFIGVDAIVGLEYVFDNAPIAISVDVLPILNLTNGVGLWFNSGLSIKYTIK